MVVIVFVIMLRLGFCQHLSEFSLATLHVNGNTIVLRSARGGTVHEVGAASLISRDCRLG